MNKDMEIESVKFMRGVTGSDPILEDGVPQVAFIGRSNVGKSSVINSIVNREIARTSSTPGFTQQINVFMLNEAVYLVDLPGYGYAKVDSRKKDKIKGMINWYFFISEIVHKRVFLIIDAKVGPTQIDMETLYSLEDKDKRIVVIANKIDKIKKSEYESKMKEIEELVGENHKIIPYSAKTKEGKEELLKEIFA